MYPIASLARLLIWNHFCDISSAFTHSFGAVSKHLFYQSGRGKSKLFSSFWFLFSNFFDFSSLVFDFSVRKISQLFLFMVSGS